MVKSDLSNTNIIVDTIENLGGQCSPRSFHDEHDKLERRFWTVVLMVMSYDKDRFRSNFEVVLGQYFTLFYEYLDFQQKVLNELEANDKELTRRALKEEVVEEKLLGYKRNKSALIYQLEKIYDDLESRGEAEILKIQLNKPYKPDWPKPEQVLNGLFNYFIHDYDLSSYYWEYVKFPLHDAQDLRKTLKELLYGYALHNIKTYCEYSKNDGAYKEVKSAAEAVRRAMIELPFEHLEAAQFLTLIQQIYRVKDKKPSTASLSKALTRALENDS